MPFLFTVLILKIYQIGTHVKKDLLIIRAHHYFGMHSSPAEGVGFENPDVSGLTLRYFLAKSKGQGQSRHSTSDNSDSHLIMTL